MNFVIVSAINYNGGNIILRYLSELLNQDGHNAKVIMFRNEDIYVRFSEKKRLSLALVQAYLWGFGIIRNILVKLGIKQKRYFPFSFKRKYFPFVSKKTIVIYSEGVYGNPLHARNVVRWFLYHNRFPNNPEAYGKNELVFSYREHFNDYTLNPTCRLLKLNYFDKDLYKQTNFGERSGNCYIIRKGKNRADLPKEFDGPIIDDLPEKEKVAVFNKCKFCYDYDTQTFYDSIAAVCGCIPIVVMEPGKTKDDYLGKGDKDWGLAFGDSPEQIEYAVKTRQLRLQMLDYEEINRKNVNNFVKIVSEYFTEQNTASSV